MCSPDDPKLGLARGVRDRAFAAFGPRSPLSGFVRSYLDNVFENVGARGRAGRTLAVAQADRGLIVRRRAVQVSAGVALTICCWSSSLARAGGEAAPATIRAVAEGVARGRPETAEVLVGVSSRAPSAAAAASDNARRMDRVMGALSGLPGGGVEMRTIDYGLHRQQPWPRPVDAGRTADRRVEFVASNTLQLRLADVTRVGAIIDLAMKAGANEIRGLRFGVRDPEVLALRALAAAVEKARARAQVLASATGLRIAGVVSAAEGHPAAVPYSGSLERAAMVQPGTPIEAGIEVRAVVTVVFGARP